MQRMLSSSKSSPSTPTTKTVLTSWYQSAFRTQYEKNRLVPLTLSPFESEGGQKHDVTESDRLAEWFELVSKAVVTSNNYDPGRFASLAILRGRRLSHPSPRTHISLAGPESSAIRYYSCSSGHYGLLKYVTHYLDRERTDSIFGIDHVRLEIPHK